MSPADLTGRLAPPAVALAEAVSLAVRIEPQLLRRARLELLPGVDAGCEADVWFSPLVESRAASGIVFRQAAAQAFRERLASRPAELHAAWRVVESMHRGISPAVFAEERLAYLSLAGKHDELRELLRSLVATLLSPRGQALAGWAARAIERFPEEARRSEEAQMLAFGASLRLGAGGLADAHVDFQRATEWASWLSPGDIRTVPFGVTLLDGAVEFGPVGRSRSNRLELPGTTPVLVSLRWEEGGTERVERVALQPQMATVVETWPGVTEVEIRTVLGDVFTLTTLTRDKLYRVRPQRVEITYEVQVGDAIELKELPFVIGVLADLSGHPSEPLPELRYRKFVEIDEDNFDAVMSAVRPALRFVVEFRTVEHGGELMVKLRFSSLSDFEPMQLIRQIPMASRWLERLSALSSLHDALTAHKEIYKMVHAIMAGAPFSKNLDLAGALVDAGFDPEEAERVVAVLRTEVEWENDGTDPERQIRSRFAHLHDNVTLLLRNVLHHPEFQKLERTWRSLRSLVDSVSTGGQVRVRVWNAALGELEKDFAESRSMEESAVCQKVYEEEYGVFGGLPFSVLVADYEFSDSDATLKHLAEVAQKATAVLLCGAPESSAVKPRPSMPAGLYAAWWREFRSSQAARFTGLTVPRVLLRAPYRKGEDSGEHFAFDEGVNAPDMAGLLWGSAAFPLAARIAAAFAEYGWCARFVGVEGGGLVERLPAVTVADTDRGPLLLPTVETNLNDRQRAELEGAGFIPLMTTTGTVYPGFLNVPIASEEGDDLRSMLTASRFAQYLRCMMRDSIGSHSSKQEAEEFLNGWLSRYVSSNEDQPEQTGTAHPLLAAKLVLQKVHRGAFHALLELTPWFQFEDLRKPVRIEFDVPTHATG